MPEDRPALWASVVGIHPLLGSSIVLATLILSLFTGLIAGTLATMLTHPFDIIKTRMQTLPQDAIVRSAATTTSASSSGTATVLAQSPPSLLAMMRHIARTDGLGAYLDGLGLRCARKAASSAIGWTIFEGGRGVWVDRYRAKQQRQAALISTAS